MKLDVEAIRRAKLLEEKIALKEKRLKQRQLLPHLYGQKMYRWQREYFECQNREAFLTAANQIGKALAYGEPVLTPRGYVPIEEIRVGERVYGQDGKLARVIAIPFDGFTTCHRITFDDGASIIASGEHLWFAKGYAQRFKKTSPVYGKWQVLSTDEIIEKGRYSPTTSSGLRYSIPLTHAIERPDANLPVPPYMMGLLLGDGSLSESVRLDTPDDEIMNYAVAAGATRIAASKEQHCLYFPKALYHEALEGMGLIGTDSFTKFIPRAYLEASKEQRLELLHGLMDTDGTAAKGGVYSYTTVSERLVEDVSELVCSLGGKVTVKSRVTSYTATDGTKKKGARSYNLYVKTTFCPFLLKRKAARWHDTKYKKERVIREIESIGKIKARCITLDNDGSFLVGKDHIVTHNSTINQRACIEWCTNRQLWKKLWPTAERPNLIWYMYPDKKTAAVEFETKFKYWLPQGELANDKGEDLEPGDTDSPIYGWKVRFTHDSGMKVPSEIEFASGMKLVFRFYSQSVEALQAQTVYACFADEEMPESHLPEVSARLNATDGYFRMVFTATLGQEYWRKTMEPRFKDEELHPGASKWQVSMYDCLYYEDGTAGPLTMEKIERAKRRCGTDAEVQRRIFGRFIKTGSNLMYEAFQRSSNVIQPRAIPPHWEIFTAIDPGAGGEDGHPTAIVFVAARPPDYTAIRVFKAWRGDGVITTPTDILIKYDEMRSEGRTPTVESYDWHSRDLFDVAVRFGIPLTPADKNRERGIQKLNALFKTGILKIYSDGRDPEIEKLITELMVVEHNVRKTGKGAIDDLCFAGETLIDTSCGLKRIDEIEIGDLVWTRVGLKPVTAKTVAFAEVMPVLRDSGTTWATRSHRYVTNQGIKRVDELSGEEACFSIQDAERLRLQSLTASFFAAIPTGDKPHTESILSLPETTVSAGWEHFTRKYGKAISGQFRKAIIFTILTATRAITALKTLSVCPRPNIAASTCEHQSAEQDRNAISCTLSARQPLGTATQRIGSFMLSLVIKHGQRSPWLKANASVAARGLKLRLSARLARSFARTTVNQNGVEIWARITSRKIVWSVARPLPPIDTPKLRPALEPVALHTGTERKRTLVYNLTVDEAHEYFADGILVLNCDALRYAIQPIPVDWSILERDPESLDLTQAEKDTERQAVSNLSPEAREIEERRRFVFGDQINQDQDFAEFAELNELHEGW